jgi:hypothetical protein
MSEGGASMGFKIAAVISALAIGGSYVACKGVEAGKAKEAKAFEDLEKDVPLIVGSKSPGREVIVLPEDLFVKDDEPLPPLLPSSKVGVFRLGKEITQEESLPVLPGSKSIGSPVFSPKNVQDVLGETEEKKVEPLKLLPGSKSINIILDNPALREDEKEP